MTDDILVKTKLFRPSPPVSVIERARLNEFMSEVGRKRLNLVVAPAGYGKSTILSHWCSLLDEAEIPCSWISLDKDDNDPIRFLRYLVTSLQQVYPELGAPLLLQLRAGGRLSYETLLASLVNEMESYPQPIGIFLDDYHLIEDSTIDNLLKWLIKYAPADVIFCIASRSRPELSLNTLNAGGRLQLITAEDLSFSAQETALLLKTQKYININDKVVQLLTDKTEGWVAAIQLALLASKDQGNAQEVIKDFSGTDRDITGYLSEVVLSRQSSELKDFLLHVACLNQLSAPLCNAVLGIDNSQTFLDKLEQANLFLISLDRNQEWYRFHHLFSDFLRSSYKQLDEEQYRANLTRAANWCSENQHPREAVRYAFRAKNYELAAELINSVCEELVLYQGELYILIEWMKELPKAHVEGWPRIHFCHIWSLVATRHFSEAQKQLNLLENYGDDSAAPSQPNAGLTPREIQAAVETCRCLIYDFLDDTDASRNSCAQWLQEHQDAPPLFLGSMNCAYAYAKLIDSEFNVGEEAVVEAVRQSRKADAQYPLAWSRAIWGMIRLARGDVSGAREIYAEGLKENNQQLGPYSYTGSLLSILQAEIIYEQNDLDKATALLEDRIGFIENEGSVETTLSGCMTLARLHANRNDLSGAMDSLKLGEEAGWRFNLPRLVKSLAVAQVELAFSEGDHALAHRLIEKHKLTARGRFFSADERAVSQELLLHVNVAVAMSKRRYKSVIEYVNPAINAYRKLGSKRKELILLLRKSSAQWRMGDADKARRTMLRSLEIGASGGFFRTFAEAGAECAEMLPEIAERLSGMSQATASHPISSDYVQKLVQAHRRDSAPLEVKTRNIDGQIDKPLQQLTKRERQILDLLGSGGSNRELAELLFISEQTLKWHLHKIYGKLGVKNRTGALVQAKRFALT